MSHKPRISSSKTLRTHSRGTGPTPLPQDASMLSSEASWSEDDDDILKFSATQFALKATNDCIQRKFARLQANAVRLKRELWLLQRHVKNFNHPLYETWEADILTRLIEVAHAHQRRHKLHAGVAIGESTVAERENLYHAYNNAVKQIRESTLLKIGLDEKYYEALLRYHEVAPYRSPNPFQTENAFAKWLIDEKEQRPAKFDFWAKLFPVCYDRTVEESASMF